jgi:hypothetical protein
LPWASWLSLSCFSVVVAIARVAGQMPCCPGYVHVGTIINGFLSRQKMYQPTNQIKQEDGYQRRNVKHACFGDDTPQWSKERFSNQVEGNQYRVKGIVRPNAEP